MALITTSVKLPKSLLDEIDALARATGRERSEVVREALRLGLRELKVLLAIDLYTRGLVSLGRAAEIAGLSLWELVEELRKRGLALRYGKERFVEELRDLGVADY